MSSQQAKDTTRRSYRISQDPKTHKNGQTLFWATIAVICLILYCCISDEDSLAGSENHFAVTKVPTVEDREQAVQIDPSFIYLDKYCKGGQSGLKCQQEQMAVLQSLIQMMAQDQQQEANQMSHNRQGSKKMQNYDFNGARSENLQQFPLEAVPNSKLTTPKTRQRTFVNSFFSFFIPEDPYEGLTSIFQSSQQQWSVEAQYPVLTVKSDRDIVPHYIELHSASEKRQRVFIVGLMLTLQRELFAFKLGKYGLEPGTNLIECESDNCQRDFSMILLKFSRMKLKRVKIYQRIFS